MLQSIASGWELIGQLPPAGDAREHRQREGAICGFGWELIGGLPPKMAEFGNDLRMWMGADRSAPTQSFTFWERSVDLGGSRSVSSYPK